MRMLYKYPQAPFPYEELVRVNRERTRDDPEYELIDTGIFDENRYFDVFVEYAKVAPDDILIRISSANHGPETADLTVLPTLWFRNHWSWGYGYPKPELRKDAASVPTIRAEHSLLGTYWLICEGSSDLLFTENETNRERCFSAPSAAPYTKDAFHRAIAQGQRDAANPQYLGTKAAAIYTQCLAAGATGAIRLRFSKTLSSHPFNEFDQVFAQRQHEADQFYAQLQPQSMDQERRQIPKRQALAGMLWSKQYYHYDINHWLKGDPAQPPPPPQRREAGIMTGHT